MKKWMLRSRNFDTIGTMMLVGPSAGELYFLRLLLCYKRGPKSYEDLRTIDGVEYHTFQKACQIMGLLDDDSALEELFLEAVGYLTNCNLLRRYFCMLLLYGNVSDPIGFFESQIEHLSVDIVRNIGDEDPDRVRNHVLSGLKAILEANQRYLKDIGLPEPSVVTEAVIEAPEETSIDCQTLNVDQRKVFDLVTGQSEEKVFMIDAPGGTGKTYLIKAVIQAFGRENVIVVASSGIAALCFVTGTTAHSRFQIPLALSETTSCGVMYNSKVAKRIRNCKLIVWDEVVMVSRFALEAVDRMLKGVCNSSEPFGGKKFLMSGDFRQILPIVRLGTEGTTVAECLNRSPLWSCVRTVSLTINMRVSDPTMHSWCEFLLRIGEGKEPMDANDCVTFPEECPVVDTEMDMVDQLFGTETPLFPDPSVAILATVHEKCDYINALCLDRLPGTVHTYKSFDKVVENESLLSA